MYSVVTAKGQITIPAQIRKKLGIKPGMLVTFRVNRQNVSINVQKSSNLIAQLKGSAKKYSKLPQEKFPQNVPLNKIRKQIADKLGEKFKP